MGYSLELASKSTFLLICSKVERLLKRATLREVLLHLAKWSRRQPECLNPQGEFPAAAE
jgi:hypothetical protein